MNHININGLIDGVSVLEANNISETIPAYPGDVIYDCNEPYDLDLKTSLDQLNGIDIQ